MIRKINFTVFKDPHSSTIQKIISGAASLAFCALLIILLPSILLFLLSLLLLMGLFSLIAKLFIAKETANIKFVYRQKNHDENMKKADEDNMIDVTHSLNK